MTLKIRPQVEHVPPTLAEADGIWRVRSEATVPELFAMWLTRECDYGLVVLAFLGTEGQGRVLSCEEMSDRLSIPYDFLAKILQKLSRAGLVAAKLGARGGYLLARDLSTIRLTDVIRAVDEPPHLVDCVEPEGCRCPRLSLCVLVEPMRALDRRLSAVLESITIGDLVAPTAEERPEAVRGAAPDARYLG